MSPETRLLIDRKLTHGVDGAVRQRQPGDRGSDRPGGARRSRRPGHGGRGGRRAFDHTGWSSDRALRKRCLLQLQEPVERKKEEIRAELVPGVGSPVATTHMAQLEMPLAEALRWPADVIDDYDWQRELPDGQQFGLTSWRRVVKAPVGVVGAITPWNHPLEIILGQARPGTGHWQHRGAQGRAGNAVVRDPDWAADRRAHRYPALRGECDHLVMISFTGSTATGRRVMDMAAPMLKRLFLELDGKSADIVLDDLDDATFATKMSLAWLVRMHAVQGCAMTTRTCSGRGWDQRSVDDQYGVRPMGALDRSKRQQRRQVLHHPPGRRLRNPKQRRDLPISKFAVIDRHQQQRIGQRQTPAMPSAGLLSTARRHHPHKLVELPRRQAGEHRHPLWPLPADDLHQYMITDNQLSANQYAVTGQLLGGVLSGRPQLDLGVDEFGKLDRQGFPRIDILEKSSDVPQ